MSIKTKTVVAIIFGVLAGAIFPFSGEANAQKKPPCGLNASALWCERQPNPEKPNIGNEIQERPNQKQVATSFSQEIARCPKELFNATVFIHDSEKNQTLKYGKTFFADNNMGINLLGENCVLLMEIYDGSKIKYIFLSDGRALLLGFTQNINDVVYYKIKIPILRWDTLQMSSGKAFRIMMSEKLSLLLRSN